jgi:DnaK suppressor protein
MHNEPSKTRYSDEELEEFKKMIELKLSEARLQMTDLMEQLAELNNSGDENRAGTFDDGASNWQREHVNKLASRQQRFIRDLEHALIRIKNKTYGICSVTGKLIDKQRLILVPHATKTVEGKSKINDRKAGPRKIEQEPTDEGKIKDGIIDEDGSALDALADFTEPTDDY